MPAGVRIIQPSLLLQRYVTKSLKPEFLPAFYLRPDALVLSLAVASCTHSISEEPTRLITVKFARSDPVNGHFLFGCNLYMIYSALSMFLKKVNVLVLTVKNEKITEVYFSLLAIYKDSC